jgi:RNA polymerase sigma-70 factor (ECF subfamily)
MIKDKNSPELNLEALQNGDRDEFASFVDAYSGQTYRLTIKMLRNQQDAEDILQETFIKAYKALPKFEGRSSLSTWLYRIATNEALMFLRRKKPDQISLEQPSDDDIERTPMDIVDWCCLPESELMSDETQYHLQKSAADLPDTLKIVFFLRDIEGLSTRETSEILEITESAVKTRLSRARLRLREDLSIYFGERVKIAQERGDL